MHFGAAMFFTDYSISPAELASALEARGFESVWVAGALAYPAVAQDALASGGELPRQYYDVMDPFVTLRRRRGDENAEARHRRLPGDPARSDPDRETGGLARPDLGRALPVRHRRRLERGRDGGPRHGLRHPLQADARADRGDAGDLDRVEARVPWRIREFRPDDDLAEAGAEAAPADHRRRRVSARRAARAATATAGCRICAGRNTGT